MDPRKWSVGQWAAAIVLLLVWLADSVTAAVDADLLTSDVEIWALKIAATLGLMSKRIGVLAERLASFGGNGPGGSGGGSITSDGKPMRYDVPSVLPRMLLQGRHALRFWTWRRGGAAVIGACLCLAFAPGCGMIYRERVQTARDATCTASVSTLEAVEAAAPLCESDRCLDRLDKVRAAAMQAASLACEERADGEYSADTISRTNRPLLHARLRARSPETMRGDHHGRAQRYQGSAVRVRSAHGAIRRVRREADAWSLELAAAGVACEERG